MWRWLFVAASACAFHPGDAATGDAASPPIDTTTPADAPPDLLGAIPIQFVQWSACSPAGNHDTVSCSFALDPMPGNAIIVVASWNGTQDSLLDVRDPAMDAYAKATVHATTGTYSQQIYVAAKIAGGPTTITATFS